MVFFNSAMNSTNLGLYSGTLLYFLIRVTTRYLEMELRNGLFSIGTSHLLLADFGNRLSNSFLSYCFWDMLINLCQVRNAYGDYTGKMESLTLTDSYVGRCHRDTSLTHNTDCERWNDFFILQIWWGWIIFNAFLEFTHTMRAFCVFLIYFLCSWFI